MAEADHIEKTESQLQALSDALETGAMLSARRMLNELNPAEIADLLESLPPTQRNLVWDLVDPDKEGDVLLEVGDEVRKFFRPRQRMGEQVSLAERRVHFSDSNGFCG